MTFVDGISLGFQFVERGECVTLPLLERVVEFVAVVHDFGEALPLLTRKPRKADLRGRRNLNLRSAAFHRGDLWPKVDDSNRLPAFYTSATIFPSISA